MNTGGRVMKTIKFVDKDKELVDKILAYQKEKRIANFTETIRILCKDALQLKEITK